VTGRNKSYYGGKMVLMISSQQGTLDSPVEARFGRSPWFIRYDIETKQWEAFQNPGVNESGGAGIAAAQFAVNQKANVVISGNFGPNAAQVFKKANIDMYLFTGEISSVSQAIEKMQQGKLTAFSK